MPTPVETPPPSSPQTEFDPLAFWILHKRKIQFLAALLVIGLLSYGIFEYAQRRAHDAASRDYSNAKTADDFRGVIRRHPGSVVAANAHLMLAERLRNEGKFDEAITTLRTFIDKYADHLLISGAWTSLGFTLEAQGKEDEALSTLQKTAATYPTTFSAPVALMAQARIFKKRADTEQAKRVYEQVVSQFGQGNFGREALMELQRLKKTEAPAAAAAAGTTVPVPSAPAGAPPPESKSPDTAAPPVPGATPIEEAVPKQAPPTSVDGKAEEPAPLPPPEPTKTPPPLETR